MLENLIPLNLKQNEEFSIPIVTWNSITPGEKSHFLNSSRLFLMRHDKDQKQTVIRVIFRKHADSTLIKS